MRRIAGPVSLSPNPARNYPYDNPRINARYLDNMAFQEKKTGGMTASDSGRLRDGLHSRGPRLEPMHTPFARRILHSLPRFA